MSGDIVTSLSRIRLPAAALILLVVVASCGSDSPTPTGLPAVVMPPEPPEPPIASVEIDPSSFSGQRYIDDLTPWAEIQLEAKALDASGNVLNRVAITCVSDPESVATVGPTGLVRTVGIGAARVTATALADAWTS